MKNYAGYRKVTRRKECDSGGNGYLSKKEVEDAKSLIFGSNAMIYRGLSI